MAHIHVASDNQLNTRLSSRNSKKVTKELNTKNSCSEEMVCSIRQVQLENTESTLIQMNFP